MLKPRTHRRIYRELAYLFEGWAEALHRKAERPVRPRPLRFPTEGELMISRMTEESLRRFAKDLAFVDGPVWFDEARHIGPTIKIRTPADYANRD